MDGRGTGTGGCPREKSIRESVLDEIPGIGEAKKIKLLRHFKSIYGIARASAEDVSAVAGVSLTTAEEVVRMAANASGEKR